MWYAAFQLPRLLEDKVVSGFQMGNSG